MKTFTGKIEATAIKFTGKNIIECIKFINSGKRHHYSCIIEKVDDCYVLGFTQPSDNGLCIPCYYYSQKKRLVCSF